MAMVGGGSGVNSGRIRVSLVDRQDRSRDIWSITNEMRAWIDDNITDGDVRIKEDQASVSGTAGGGLGNGGGAFRLELRGNDMADLIRASEMAQQMLKSGAYGVTDVSCTYQEGLPEISLIPDREKLKHYASRSALSMTRCRPRSAAQAQASCRMIRKITAMTRISMFISRAESRTG